LLQAEVCVPARAAAVEPVPVLIVPVAVYALAPAEPEEASAALPQAGPVSALGDSAVDGCSVQAALPDGSVVLERDGCSAPAALPDGWVVPERDDCFEPAAPDGSVEDGPVLADSAGCSAVPQADGSALDDRPAVAPMVDDRSFLWVVCSGDSVRSRADDLAVPQADGLPRADCSVGSAAPQADGLPPVDCLVDSAALRADGLPPDDCPVDWAVLQDGFRAGWAYSAALDLRRPDARSADCLDDSQVR
jgi:hypothetical protein